MGHWVTGINKWKHLQKALGGLTSLRQIIYNQSSGHNAVVLGNTSISSSEKDQPPEGYFLEQEADHS